MDYLPVFLDLRARRTLVVGGGPVAMRKVELLLKAHALVRVVAPALHPELALYRDAGRIEHQPVEFEPSHFDGIVFAIAATDRPEVNGAVAAAGATRGVFVNVVDDQSASSCIMPAIVDRSPVVVAIGSSGQSPTLVRRVRAQLEALLPEGLGDLARLAGRARERIARALPDLDRRRRFWDRLFDGGIATAVLSGQAASAQAMLEQALEQEVRAVPGAGARGEVYLIGAGPGDPDLLTLRALQLLQQADVLLYDRLVSPAILDRARREATRVFVGKDVGESTLSQERINQLLIDHARRGLKVARLKGGDPFIFGRGGEEIAALAGHGIPVTVVPGITAALGAAAAAQIPLTLRDVSQSVTFAPGHVAVADTLDWPALARSGHTVVFYMAMAQLGGLTERLQKAGAPPDRPVALIVQATLPTQRVVHGTLADIAELARTGGFGAPALLFVGDVTRLVH